VEGLCNEECHSSCSDDQMTENEVTGHAARREEPEGKDPCGRAMNRWRF
jgi:hypothetical protein